MGTKSPGVTQRVASAAAEGLTATEQLRYGADPSAKVRRVVAGRSDLVNGVAVVLAGDPDQKVRRALAENVATAPGILITLLDDADFFTRWSAAQNGSADDGVHLAALAGTHADTADAVGQLGDQLSADVLEAVLAHPRWQARQQLALSTSSPEVLGRLSVDPAPAVRGAVATSEHLEDVLLRALAADPRAEVRAAAATAARLPRELAEGLARDRSVNVRFWLTANSQYDAELAGRHVDDPDEHLRRHARWRATGEPPT